MRQRRVVSRETSAEIYRINAAIAGNGSRDVLLELGVGLQLIKGSSEFHDYRLLSWGDATCGTRSHLSTQPFQLFLNGDAKAELLELVLLRRLFTEHRCVILIWRRRSIRLLPRSATGSFSDNIPFSFWRAVTAIMAATREEYLRPGKFASKRLRKRASVETNRSDGEANPSTDFWKLSGHQTVRCEGDPKNPINTTLILENKT